MIGPIDLTVVWALIIAFAVFAYACLDGFDLGIGILFPFFPVGKQRDQAMNAIAPFWDGNETWLVLGGGGLFAAFPLAYGVIATATYPLIIAMLLALVFRGVAFEFRWRQPGHRRFWDGAFVAGSFVAAFAQGVILGTLLQGIVVEEQSYAGDWFDWLTPFSLLTGLSVVIAYGLLGAAWLIWKLEGPGQDRARHYAWRLAWCMLGAMALVSATTPFLVDDYWRNWFEMPGFLFTSQVPILSFLSFAGLFYMIPSRGEKSPFFLVLFLFFLCFVGLGISMYPDIIPETITIWQAATAFKSQLFMLVGAGIMVPIILAYSLWVFWVFRGKVGDEGYHQS